MFLKPQMLNSLSNHMWKMKNWASRNLLIQVHTASVWWHRNSIQDFLTREIILISYIFSLFLCIMFVPLPHHLSWICDGKDGRLSFLEAIGFTVASNWGLGPVNYIEEHFADVKGNDSKSRRPKFYTQMCSEESLSEEFINLCSPKYILTWTIFAPSPLES